MAAPSSPRLTLASLRGRAKDLLALARDPSAAARATLVSSLYDLSRAGTDLPAGERALAVDVVLEIIKRAEADVRRQLAEQVAHDPSAPKVLVLALARDQISVAFPVLLESAVFDDSDLVQIVRESHPEYQLAALQREIVGAAVSEAVVESRDTRSMRWLVENPGADIPRGAMEVIVEAARAEPELQKPLVDRSDVPADLAAKIYAFVPDDLRQRMVAQHRVDAAVSPSQAGAAAAGSRPAAARRRPDLPAGTPTVDLLVRTVRAGRMAEFEGLFARFCGVAPATARRMLASPTGEGLAVALKAHGVDKGTFATIFILSRKAHDFGPVSSAMLARATDAFDRLKTTDAEKRLAALQAARPDDTVS